jgi:hypothetical protein
MSTPKIEGRHQWLTPRRLAAATAMVFLLAACVSDFIVGSFWARHTMFTAIASTILVALVSVTVVEVVLDQRSEQRWRLLAQYGLFELADNANVTWLTILKKLDVAGAGDLEASQVHALLDSPDVVQGIRTFLDEALGDAARREGMLKVVEELVIRNQALITRWNVVMHVRRALRSSRRTLHPRQLPSVLPAPRHPHWTEVLDDDDRGPRNHVLLYRYLGTARRGRTRGRDVDTSTQDCEQRVVVSTKQ